jgi:4-alpha-glucanotransferase
VVSATLEDLVEVEDRPNRPGTVDDENWSEALPLPLEELEVHPPALDVIGSLTQRGG